MATSNDKIGAIKSAALLGYEVNIRIAKPTELMVVSIVKDGVEEKSFMDKSFGKETKAIVGSCMIEFVEYMQSK